MAQITLTRAFDTRDEAHRAVAALEAAGIPHGNLTLVGRDGAHGAPVAVPAHGETLTGEERLADAEAGAGTGASIGTILGGGAGLLAGIGSLAIPGVGPVVAAGWLVATLTGAGVGAALGGGAGGLVGALVGAGVEEDDAHVYAETVRRGGNVVSVRVDELEVPAVEAVLDRFSAIDTGARRAVLRDDGWERHDAAGEPWTGNASAARPAPIFDRHPGATHSAPPADAPLPPEAPGLANAMDSQPLPGVIPGSPASQPGLGAGARSIMGDDPEGIGGVSSGLGSRIGPI